MPALDVAARRPSGTFRLDRADVVPVAPTTTTAPTQPAAADVTAAPTNEPVSPQRQDGARRAAAARDAAGAARIASVPTPATGNADLDGVRNGSVTLRRGSNGPAVLELQRALNRAGAQLGVDGDFGPATERAVRAFQGSSGLGVDGVVGKNTIAALDARTSTTPTDPTAPTNPTNPTAPAGPTAPLPAGTSDVGNLQAGELSRLKTSSDPADRRRAATIERAQTAYADHISRGGRVLVSTSTGNGGHPVLTLVPPGFDPSKPASVQTHYHGFNATVADSAGHSSGTNRAMMAAQRADSQRIFVLPEASNARAGNYATDWSNVRSQAQTTDDALRGAGVSTVSERIVSAHSGGGSALQRAMQSRADGSGVRADHVVLHDSLYGSESAVAAWGGTAAGRAARVTYVHGSNDAGRDVGIARAFGNRYERIDVRGSDVHNRALYDHLSG